MTDTERTEARARDEATRSEMRANLRRNLFVEAGAGTGKTRAIVDQIVALVRSGVALDRMVAITFTEKAAAELKDRVRSGLEEALAAGSGDAGVLDEALRSLDRAQISTIHAFGQALLRNFAAESGIDPAFAVQDEMRAERRLQERWRAYLESIDDAASQAAIDRALGLGMATWDLWTLVHELGRRPGLAAQLSAHPLVSPDPYWPDLNDLSARLAALPLDPAPAGERLRAAVERLSALVERTLHAGPDREAALAAGAEILIAKLKVGRGEDWDGVEIKKHVQDTAISVRDTLNGVLQCCRSSALADVLPLVVRFVEDDAAARRREGTLIFDDLILGPRDLLRAYPDAARSLRARFDVLLLDEFQDTDPLQVDIALAFATDPDTGVLEQGRLFLVGDPKQSIYRFRRADMAVYSAASDRLKAEGAAFPALSLNRRSREVITDFVNSVFGCLMGDDARPHIQPTYREIEAHRFEELEGPGIALIGGMLSESASRARTVESAAVAAQCQAVVNEGWEVASRDGTARRASFRDIAILIPTRTSLIPLERALTRSGIPYRVEGGSLIYQTQEVRDLINCLTAIDNPGDEVAVVAALRSPAFACDDVELARHRAAGGRFNYLSPGLDALSGPVTDALALLSTYHSVRNDGSLASLIERFVGERGLVEIGLLVDASRDSFRRVRFVIEHARMFEASGPESLRAFTAWLEQLAGKEFLDNDGAGLDDDEDAVRILTIHGAKGLEFPIVFLAGLGSGPNHRRPVFAMDRSSSEVAVRVGAVTRNACFELNNMDGLHDLEKQHAAAERDRLLYVATTRARDHLIVSVYHPKGANDCAARRLLNEGLAGAAAGLRPEIAPRARHSGAPFADLTVDLPAAPVSSFAEARAALVAAARTRRYTSATALGGEGAGAKEEPPEEAEPWARGRGGTHLGRAVHATLQSVSLDAGDDEIEAYARAQSVAEAIPGRAHEIAALVRKALESEAASRARLARRALREVPFAVAAANGSVLEGFIDMVIENGDRTLEIVDWKTDYIAAIAVAERLRQYELQAGLYVFGLEAATGYRVARITYVFAAPGIEMSPGDPQALSSAAQALLRA